MKNRWLLLILFLIGFGSAQAKKLGLTFDAQGKMITPDAYLVEIALKNNEVGNNKDAMWQMKEAAEYGNKHGQYYAGLLHLQQDDYVNGYAWLKLSGDQFMNNAILLPSINQTLNERGLMKQAQEEYRELSEKINFESSKEKRSQWFKKPKLVRPHVGVNIPVFWSPEIGGGRIDKNFYFPQLNKGE